MMAEEEPPTLCAICKRPILAAGGTAPRRETCTRSATRGGTAAGHPPRSSADAAADLARLARPPAADVSVPAAGVRRCAPDLLGSVLGARVSRVKRPRHLAPAYRPRLVRKIRLDDPGRRRGSQNMPFFHAIAVLSGNRQKTIPNRSEEQVLSQIVLPFVSNGVISAKWGKTTQSYQVLELRIYETTSAWDKRNGPLGDLIKRKRNQFPRFEGKAQKLLGKNSPRVFVVMPIQGEKHGTQEDQRVYREYDERFVAVESVIARFGGVAIRIDKEHPLEDLVGRIKKEIRDAAFVVADLTDERPSCYFEAGYAEALPRPVIYVASKQSVLKPGTPTKIHFDIHMNVQTFTNHKELKDKLGEAIEKNKAKLFSEAVESGAG